MASGLHRLVKELEKQRGGRKFTFTGPSEVELEKAALSKMAAKKKQAENFAFQIDVETDAQWWQLLRREGLILVDVYASWAGPCISMISTLKRVKVEVNDDRLWLATAKSDDIADLLMFKDQSEPTWLFIGGGKPVKVIRGAHAPKLVNTIKSEFERELLCMQGKQKRNLISIDDEVSRRRKAEAEAMRLVKLIKEEDETAEQLNELRKESSLRLIKLMEPYTVLIVQSFLLETGVVTEIRDALQGDFKVEQERTVHLDEAAVRQLFRIPYKVPDPNQPLDDLVGEDEEEDEELEFGPPPEDADAAGEEEEDEGDEGEGEEGAARRRKSKRGKKRWLDVPLPDGLVDDTLFLLLESVDVSKLRAAGKGPDKDSVLQTADDYIQLKVGPVSLADAREHAPYSFHALYGRGQHEPGVWCPRNYEDKRYVMVNYFPRFVTDILVPPAAGEPRFTLVLFPKTAAAEVSRHIEGHMNDVVAEGTVKIPKELVEQMAATWEHGPGAAADDELKARKHAITDKEVFAISVDRKNSTLLHTLSNLDPPPLHVSADVGYGRIETAILFPKLELSLEETPGENPDEIIEKFLARTPHRVASLSEFVEKEMPKTKKKQGEGAEGEEGESEGGGGSEEEKGAAAEEEEEGVDD